MCSHFISIKITYRVFTSDMQGIINILILNTNYNYLMFYFQICDIRVVIEYIR